MGKTGKSQKFSLADFTSMVEQATPGTSSSWADDEVELPTAPTGASSARLPSSTSLLSSSSSHLEAHRPGRGLPDRRSVAPADLSKIPAGGPYVLHIANLPYSVTPSLLRDTLFAGDGYNLGDVKVPMDSASGRARGFAYVTVGSAEEMHRALEEVHGRELGGRQVRLDVAEQQQLQQQHAHGSRDWRAGSASFQPIDRPGRRTDGRMTGLAAAPPVGTLHQSLSSLSSSSSSSIVPHGDWRGADRSDNTSTSSAASFDRHCTAANSDSNSFSAASSRNGGERRRPGRSQNTSSFVFTREDFGKKLH